MTGGGDLDEILDDEGGADADNGGGLKPGADPGREVDPADGGLLEAAEEDPTPSAGGSDVGGRAGDSDS